MTEPEPEPELSPYEAMIREPDLIDHFYYDHAGQPMTVEAWGDAFTDYEACKLAVTTIGDTRVITMWLGTADERADNGLPLIFGSIIKYGTASVQTIMNDDTWGEEIRTPTADAAMIAHRLLVSKVRTEPRR